MEGLLERTRLFIKVCASRIGVGSDTISITGDNSVLRLLQDIEAHLELMVSASSQLEEGGLDLYGEEGSASTEAVVREPLEESAHVFWPDHSEPDADISVGSTQSLRIMTQFEWESEGYPSPCIVVARHVSLSPTAVSKLRSFRRISGEENG